MANQRGKSIVEDKTDQIPIGMRVLAVDSDPACLSLLEQILRHYQYQVTVTSSASIALTRLIENREAFDLVITEIDLPDKDGLEFLQQINLKIGIPVVIVSARSERKLVKKCVTLGACDFLLKPLRFQEFLNIWQHVVRKKIANRRRGLVEVAPTPTPAPAPDHHDGNAWALVISDRSHTLDHPDSNAGALVISDRSHGTTENDQDPITVHKKPRMVWTLDLHIKFIDAISQVGIDGAGPKKIQELMNVERLTRWNVSSHLQKYRSYLRNMEASERDRLLASLSARNTRASDVTTQGRNDQLTYHGYGSSGLNIQDQTQMTLQTPLFPNPLEWIQMQQPVAPSSFHPWIPPTAGSSGFTVGGGSGSSSNAWMIQGNGLHPPYLRPHGCGSLNWPLPDQLPSDPEPALHVFNISSYIAREHDRIIQGSSANTVNYNHFLNQAHSIIGNNLCRNSNEAAVRETSNAGDGGTPNDSDDEEDSRIMVWRP